MNDRDQRRYDRLTRVQTFGVENTADFAAGSKAKTHFGNLDGLIEKLDNAKAGQTPNRVSKETLLDAVMIDLKNLARTARSIELTEKGFAAPYRIPDNPSESAITTYTDAVLQRLEDQPADSAATQTAIAALRARFVACELPADFVTHLRADRNAIADANRRKPRPRRRKTPDSSGNCLGRRTTSPDSTPSCTTNTRASRETARLAKRQPRRTRSAAEKKPAPAPHRRHQREISEQEARQQWRAFFGG